MEQCRQCYVLCDASKFNSISSVTFADFEKPIFITDRKVPGYEKSKHIIVCETERNKKPTSYTHINCKAPGPADHLDAGPGRRLQTYSLISASVTSG